MLLLLLLSQLPLLSLEPLLHLLKCPLLCSLVTDTEELLESVLAEVLCQQRAAEGHVVGAAVASEGAVHTTFTLPQQIRAAGGSTHERLHVPVEARATHKVPLCHILVATLDASLDWQLIQANGAQSNHLLRRLAPLALPCLLLHCLLYV